MYNSQIPQSFPRSAFESNTSIDLPFYDDFSDYLVYPKSSHWIDNDVFVNRNYPINPIKYWCSYF